MTQLNAFVARSFDPDDEQKILPVLNFLDTFRKAGFFWETAEAAEVQSVSKKVRGMIDERDVFIGFFTRRCPTYASTSRIRGAWQLLLGKMEPQSWSAPAWVLQESGYALRADKDLILLLENGVVLSGLQGDQEYVPFDPSNPGAVFPKLSEMIHGLLAKAAGTTVSVTLTERQEQTQVAMEATAPEVPPAAPTEAGEGPDIVDLFSDMVDAANIHDLDAVAEAWRAGVVLIADPTHQGIDRISWDCLYFENRFTAGATDALENLKRLSDENPTRFEPKRAMASCYFKSKEFDLAASLSREIADSQDGDRKARSLVMAARAFRVMKRWDEGLVAIRTALPIIPDDLRDEAISLHYHLLKERGDVYLAFATGEAALHENPLLPIRFTLGLDYRSKAMNEIALYHFKSLYDRDGNDASSLHNLALLSAECKLPIMAVDRYRTAFGLGNSLSAANLGFLYLDSGMATEAKALINEAMKPDDHVLAVETCLADIGQRRENEREKETEILKEAAETRGFFLDMGRALSDPAPAISGKWKFPFGEMQVALISGNLHGNADVKRQEMGLAQLMLAKIGEPPTYKIDTYVLSGKLTGSACEFQLTIGEKGELGVAGLILAHSPSKFGFVVFAPDGRSAKYVERSDSKLGNVENIKRS
jgi:tetratricopeptide (TPR) repeat protein